ncbi:hypothetical protein [Chishuiella sp.]|uniref:hypothetical protein n=1 Tax=Chishuiella sp. TaxID=1969467 RepID=UPI0028A8BA38|nr:hypothetical protein [Chishuiella sp.]
MEINHVQIALDFHACSTQQKKIFFYHLDSLNWEAVNPETLWITNLCNEEGVIQIIENELLFAKNISCIEELDYVIITDDEIYFSN